MEQVNVYTINELKELHPESFERAHRDYVDWVSSEPLFSQDEIMGSLKATFEHAGIDLRNWSISDSSPCYVKFNDINDYEDGHLYTKHGKDALNWIKDAYDLKSVKRVNFTYKNDHGRKVKGFRYDITKKDGTPWSCEFTGICYDHDFIDSLLDDIKSGCTLSDAYHNLADKAGKLFYDEYVSQCTEEYFLDFAEANEYKYLENGVQI